MSTPDCLTACRATLLDLDELLKAEQDTAVFLALAAEIGRARGMIRGAEQRLSAALLRYTGAAA